MDKIFIIIGVVIAIIAVGYVGLAIFNKRRMSKLFLQIQMNANQVPKQKKKNFILLMLMETLSASKKKNKTSPNRLNNQKYVDIQMIKMSKLLNPSTVVKDKKAKHAIRLLQAYYNWEDKQRGIVKSGKSIKEQVNEKVNEKADKKAEKKKSKSTK